MEGLNHQTLAEGSDDFFMELADQFRNEGFQEGLQQGLLEGIELGLELRFGDISHTMIHDFECIHDVKKLQTIKDAILHVQNTDELRDIVKKL